MLKVWKLKTEKFKFILILFDFLPLQRCSNYGFHPCPTEIANQTVSTPAWDATLLRVVLCALRIFSVEWLFNMSRERISQTRSNSNITFSFAFEKHSFSFLFSSNNYFWNVCIDIKFFKHLVNTRPEFLNSFISKLFWRKHGV